MSEFRLGGEFEERTFTEVRSQGRILEGYVALFNEKTTLGHFTEEVAPGAFTETLRGKGGFKKNGDILALLDHNMEKVLGRTRSGSLQLAEDAKGLRFQLQLPNTEAGRDVVALAERGDLGGCSFRFPVTREGQTWQGDHRTLTKIHLHEVSVCTAIPAYDKTVQDLQLRRADFFGDRHQRHLLLCIAEANHWV